MKQLLQNVKTGKSTVEDVPVPTPREGQALVKVEASLVSAGTERMVVEFAEKSLVGKARSRPDLVKQVIDKARREGLVNTAQAAFNRLDQPMALGYSSAGTIIALGDGMQGFKIGQRVSGEGHLVGLRSRMSRAGRFHLDPETRGIGVNVPGAFAEFLKLPAFNLVALPDAIEDDSGSILDPLGNAVHCALSFDLVGEDVLITGAGPIGIMAAAVARHVGARHVVITDVNEYRLELAGRVADVRPSRCARFAPTDSKSACAMLRQLASR